MLRPVVIASALLLLSPGTVLSQAVERWSLTPELRIGSLDDPAYGLSEISGFAVAPDGRMFVALIQEGEIRTFGPDGQFLEAMGGSGRGPGEFQRLGGIGLRGDTLFAIDETLNRLTYFGDEGRVIHTVSFTRSVGEPYLPAPPAGILADGSFLVRPRVPNNVVRDLSDPTVPLLRMDRDEAVLDTLVRISASGKIGVFSFSGFSGAITQPIPTDPLWQRAPEGTHVVIVEREPAEAHDVDRFRVMKIGWKGDAIFDRHFSYRPQRVARRDVEARIGAHTAAIREAVRSAGGREGEEALDRTIEVPLFAPPVTRLVIGTDNSIWLRREDIGRNDVSWIVLDDTGSPMGRLTTPVGWEVLAASDTHLWVEEQDDFDVPFVLRQRIQRPR